MRVQRAFRVTRGARGVDDQRGIVGRGIDRHKIRRRRLERRPERSGALGRAVADDIDMAELRQPVADFGQFLPAARIGDDGPGAGIRQPEFQRILAKQRKQRDRDHAGAERRHMHDRQFQRLRQEHGDAIAAHQAVGLQHVGEAPGEIAKLVERGARGAAVFIDIDQRQPRAAIGVAVAARGCDIEARRNLPAEAAIEVVVIGGFGEHGRHLCISSWPDLFRPSTSYLRRV